jgi:hypothetical protein
VRGLRVVAKAADGDPAGYATCERSPCIVLNGLGRTGGNDDCWICPPLGVSQKRTEMEAAPRMREEQGITRMVTEAILRKNICQVLFQFVNIMLL